MSYTGIVDESGVINLPPEAHLPAGTKVRVEVIGSSGKTGNVPIRRKLMAFSGIAKDWPADFAANHDHYLYGAKKH